MSPELTPVDEALLERAIRATFWQLEHVKDVANAQLTGGFNGGSPEIVAAMITATATNYLAQVTKRNG